MNTMIPIIHTLPLSRYTIRLIFAKSIQDIGKSGYPKFVISRVWRDGAVSIPTSDKILKENDRLLVITTEKDVPALTILFGEQENRDWNKEDIDWNAIDKQTDIRNISLLFLMSATAVSLEICTLRL